MKTFILFQIYFISLQMCRRSKHTTVRMTANMFLVNYSYTDSYSRCQAAYFSTRVLADGLVLDRAAVTSSVLIASRRICRSSPVHHSNQNCPHSRSHQPCFDLRPSSSVPCESVVVIHTYAKDCGQWSIGSTGRVETNGHTDRANCITFLVDAVSNK